MKAYQIMNGNARWPTQDRTASDCDYAIIRATDRADWEESWVIFEDTLNAGGFMTEVFREVKGNTG